MEDLTQHDNQICKNCDAPLKGPYCHHCGQKNVDLQLSFWKIVKYFFDEITFFDNKIFHTLKLLVYHPAKIAQDYIDGKRARYVPPFRLFLFLSSLFFIFAISDFKESFVQANNNRQKEQSTVEMDSVSKAQLEEFNLVLNDSTYVNRSWAENLFIKKARYLKAIYNDNTQELTSDIAAAFSEKLPYLLYLSLPFLAFLLWLFYRDQTKRLYVDHFVFSLYLVSAIFFYLILQYLIEFTISILSGSTVSIPGTDMIFFVLLPLTAIYLFYKQSVFKTIYKFILVDGLTVIFMGILMMLFLTLSVFSL